MSSEPAAQAATVAGAAGETIAAQGADAMIFGFNTDVPGKDAVYHVQTEDRGAKNPVIESMIYVGGKILGRRRTPYVPSELSREKIEDAVRRQHKELVESIRAGTWVPSNDGGLEPPANRAYAVELLNASDLRDGEVLRFRLAIRDEQTKAPAECSIECRWLLGGVVADRKPEGSRASEHELCFPVPADHSYAALLVCIRGSRGVELAKFHVRSSTSN